MSMQDMAFPLTPQEKIAALRMVRRTTGYDQGVILAIDPGPERSGWCLYDSAEVGAGLIKSGVMGNEDLARQMNSMGGHTLAVERVASYGMAVGREVFETCEWVGSFRQVWHHPHWVRLIYRRDIKLHLCGSSKAKDANIRQALLDKFPRTGGGKTPQIGTKKQPGPLYGVATHAWAALALAVYVSEVKP